MLPGVGSVAGQRSGVDQLRGKGKAFSPTGVNSRDVPTKTDTLHKIARMYLRKKETSFFSETSSF